MNDEQRGWGALFPVPFWVGSSVSFITLLALAWWPKGSNFLVESGLLISSKKEHLFTLPEVFHGVGVTPRTLVAIVGVIAAVGGLFVLVDVVRKGEHSPTDDELPPPPPPPDSMSRSPDPTALAAASGGGMVVPLPPVTMVSPEAAPMTGLPSFVPPQMG